MTSLNILFGLIAALLLLIAFAAGWRVGYLAGRVRQEIDKRAAYLAGVREERAAQAREPLWLDDGEQWKRGGRS